MHKRLKTTQKTRLRKVKPTHLAQINSISISPSQYTSNHHFSPEITLKKSKPFLKLKKRTSLKPKKTSLLSFSKFLNTTPSPGFFITIYCKSSTFLSSPFRSTLRLNRKPQLSPFTQSQASFAIVRASPSATNSTVDSDEIPSYASPTSTSKSSKKTQPAFLSSISSPSSPPLPPPPKVEKSQEQELFESFCAIPTELLSEIDVTFLNSLSLSKPEKSSLLRLRYNSVNLNPHKVSRHFHLNLDALTITSRDVLHDQLLEVLEATKGRSKRVGGRRLFNISPISPLSFQDEGSIQTTTRSSHSELLPVELLSQVGSQFGYNASTLRAGYNLHPCPPTDPSTEDKTKLNFQSQNKHVNINLHPTKQRKQHSTTANLFEEKQLGTVDTTHSARDPHAHTPVIHSSISSQSKSIHNANFDFSTQQFRTQPTEYEFEDDELDLSFDRVRRSSTALDGQNAPKKSHSGFNIWMGSVVDSQERYQGALLSALTLLRTGHNVSLQLLQHLTITLRDYGRFQALPRYCEFFLPTYEPNANGIVTGVHSLQDANEINLMSNFTPRKQKQITNILQIISSHLSPKSAQVLFQDQYIPRRLDALAAFVLDHPNIPNFSKLTRSYNIAVKQYGLVPPPRLHSTVLIANHFLTMAKTDTPQTPLDAHQIEHRSLTISIKDHISPPQYMNTHAKHKISHTLIERSVKQKDGKIRLVNVPKAAHYGTTDNPICAPGSINIHKIPQLGQDYALPTHMFSLETLCHDAIGVPQLNSFYKQFNRDKAQFGDKIREKLSSHHLILLPPTLSHFTHLLTSPLVFGNFSTRVYNSTTQTFSDSTNTTEILPGMLLGVYHCAPEGFSTHRQSTPNPAPLFSHSHHHVISIDLHRCLTDSEYALTQFAYIFGDMFDSNTSTIKHTLSKISDVSLIPLHNPSSIGQLALTHEFLHQLDSNQTNPATNALSHISAMTPAFDQFGAPLFSQRDDIARHATIIFSVKYRWLQAIWESMRYEHVLTTQKSTAELNINETPEAASNRVYKMSDMQQQPKHQKSKHFLKLNDQEFEKSKVKNPFREFDRLNNPEKFDKENPHFHEELEWGDHIEEDDDGEGPLQLDEEELTKAYHRNVEGKKQRSSNNDDIDDRFLDGDSNDDVEMGVNPFSEGDLDDLKEKTDRHKMSQLPKRSNSGKIKLDYDKFMQQAPPNEEDVYMAEALEMMSNYKELKTFEINEDPLLVKYRQSLYDPAFLLPTPSIYTLEFTRALLDLGIYHEMYLFGNDVVPESAELISNNLAKIGWSDTSLALLSSTTHPSYSVFNSSTEVPVVQHKIQASKNVNLQPTVSALRIVASEERKKTGSDKIDQRKLEKQRVKISDPFVEDFPARQQILQSLCLDPHLLQASTTLHDGTRKLDSVPSHLLFSGIQDGDSTYQDLHIPLLTQQFIHNIRNIVQLLGNSDENFLSEMMVSVIAPQKYQLYQQSPDLYNLQTLEEECQNVPLSSSHLNQILSQILQQPEALTKFNLHVKPTVRFPTQYQTESYLSANNLAQERYGLRLPAMAPYETNVLATLDQSAIKIIHSGGSLERAREIANIRVSVRDVIKKRLNQKLEIFSAAIREHRGKVKAIGMISELVTETDTLARKHTALFTQFNKQVSNSTSDCDQVLDLLFRQSKLGEHLIHQTVKTQPVYNELMQNTQTKRLLSNYDAIAQSQIRPADIASTSAPVDAAAAADTAADDNSQSVAPRIKQLQILTETSQLDPQLMITRLEQEQPLFRRLQPTFLASVLPLSPVVESLVPLHAQTSYFAPIGITQQTPQSTIDQLSVLHKGATEFPTLSAGVLLAEYHINNGNYATALDSVIRTLMHHDLYRKLTIAHLKKMNLDTKANLPSRNFPYPQLFSYGFMLSQTLGDWSTATWLIQYVRSFNFCPSLARITQLADSIHRALPVPMKNIDPNSEEGAAHMVTVDTILRLRQSIGKKLWLTTKSTVVHTTAMTLDVHFVLSILQLYHNLDDIMQLYFEALAWPVNVNTKFFTNFQKQIQLVASSRRHLHSPDQLKQYNSLQNYLQFIMQRVFSQQFRLYQELQTENIDLLSTLYQIRLDHRLSTAQSTCDVGLALECLWDLHKRQEPITSSHWGFVLGAISNKWKRIAAYKAENKGTEIAEGESAQVNIPSPSEDSKFNFTLSPEQQQDTILAHRIFSLCILEDKLEDHHLWINMLKIASTSNDSAQVLAITQLLFSLNGIQSSSILPYHPNSTYTPHAWNQDKFGIYNVTWDTIDDLAALRSSRTESIHHNSKALISKGSAWNFSQQLTKRLLQSYKTRVKPINAKNVWNALELRWSIQDLIGPYKLKQSLPLMGGHEFSSEQSMKYPDDDEPTNILFGYCLPSSTLDRLRLQTSFDSFQYYLTLYYARLQQQNVSTPITQEQLSPVHHPVIDTSLRLPDYSSLLSNYSKTHLPSFTVQANSPQLASFSELYESYQQGTLSNSRPAPASLAPNIPKNFYREPIKSLSLPPVPPKISAKTLPIGLINTHPLLSVFSPIHHHALASSVPLPSPEMLNISIPHLTKISPIHGFMTLLWTINQLQQHLSSSQIAPTNLTTIDAETSKPPLNPLQYIQHVHHEFAVKHNLDQTSGESKKVKNKQKRVYELDSDFESDSYLDQDDIFYDGSMNSVQSSSNIVSISYEKTLQTPESQYVLANTPHTILSKLTSQEQSRLIQLAKANNNILLNGFSKDDIAGIIVSTARSLYSSGYYGFAIAVFDLAPLESTDYSLTAPERYTDGFGATPPPTFSSIQLNNSHDVLPAIYLDVRNMDPIHSAVYIRSRLQLAIQDVLNQMVAHHNNSTSKSIAFAAALSGAADNVSTDPANHNASNSVHSIISSLQSETAITSYNPYNSPALIISTGDFINPDRVIQESFLYHFHSEFNIKSINQHPLVVDMLYSDHTTSTSYNQHVLYPSLDNAAPSFDQLYSYLFDSNNTGQLVVTPYTITNIAYNMFSQLYPESTPTTQTTAKPSGHEYLRRLGELDIATILQAEFHNNISNLNPPGPKTQPTQHSWWKNLSAASATTKPPVLTENEQLFLLTNATPTATPATSASNIYKHFVDYHWTPPNIAEWVSYMCGLEQKKVSIPATPGHSPSITTRPPPQNTSNSASRAKNYSAAPPPKPGNPIYRAAAPSVNFYQNPRPAPSAPRPSSTPRPS